MSGSANTTWVNEDFNASVSMTDYSLQALYPVEHTADRFTALGKLPVGETLGTRDIQQQPYKLEYQQANSVCQQSDIALPDLWRGLELLIIEGEIDLDKQRHGQGSYIRLPANQDGHLTATSDCVFFIKLNQFLKDDNGLRIIDTQAADKWLPGPVDGIEIRPLHVFDTESIMLLRWHHAAEFKPRLNPRGEEILVINGLLQTRDHLYRQYSWIRNPIEDWRKWHGNTGTLAYYKSGHFPDDPAREKADPEIP